MIIFAFELNNLCIEKYFHLRRIECFICSNLISSQFRTAYQKCDFGAKTCQESSLFNSAISAPNHSDFASFVKWAIASCAEMYTCANVVSLSWNSKAFIGRTCSNQNSIAAVSMPGFSFDKVRILIVANSYHILCREQFDSIALRLLNDSLGKVSARHSFGETGIIIETLANASLSSKATTFDDQNIIAIARPINCRS